MNKTHILQFTLAASKGGQTQYILNIWKHIDKELFTFDFVTFADKLDFEQELEQQGCKIFHISVYPEENKEEFVRQFKTICKQHYDVIEIHTAYWKDKIVEEIAFECGIPKIIIHSHGAGITREIGTDDYDKALSRHCFIRNSITKELATDFWGCSKDALTWLFPDEIVEKYAKVIPNTIDTNRFSFDIESRNNIRKINKLQDKFVVGFVGRLENVKNPFFIIDLIEETSKILKNIFLILVGNGKLKEKIQNRVYEKDLVGRVKFVPFTNEVEKYYCAMDAFVQPSYSESFSLVTLEAQCTGLPCLISEAIPDDVVLTDCVTKLSVDKLEDWTQELVKISKLNTRNGKEKTIREKGYHTMDCIKELENLYRGNNNIQMANRI